ncbi:hypothetical protein [Nocardioides mangrovi]|uniref:Uncharacterized protein n=1 Tax=Nocardioides mangrovi TaxID=2874580 RepID=A0ABS7UDV2_9ACTN|nr:hypothetical protein [Nocardioides mangrovi]MBZ5738995.1 hypothetical protein [Nocardioides mangrovi]
MAFIDTTPTSLVIEHLTTAERRSRLDSSAAYTLAIERYGYVTDLVPDAD